jgi:hypothetical protein
MGIIIIIIIIIIVKALKYFRNLHIYKSVGVPLILGGFPLLIVMMHLAC